MTYQTKRETNGRRSRALILGCLPVMTAAALLSGTTQAGATSVVVKPRPVCAGAAQPNPIAVTLTGVRRGYVRGGGWSTLRLTLRNRTRTVCGQLKPVLVYGARSRTLRVDALRLETRLAGRWRPVGVEAALDELAGEVGPSSGLSLRPGATTALTLRMRLTRSAPTGDWLSLAVAYAPLQTGPGKGAPSGTATQAWPVGVTDPLYFRVTSRPAR